MTFLERLFVKVKHGPNGCWLWTGSVNNQGYGTIRPETHRRTVSPVLAHRALYQRLIGDIPFKRELDHLCRDPRCVNPTHLEPVTHRENMRRGLPGQSKDVCKQGHALTADNIYRFKNGAKTCRRCALARAARQRASRMAAA